MPTLVMMDSSTLTDWFPGKVPPARTGLYQIKAYEDLYFSYFDGASWSWGYRDPANVKPEQKRCSPPYRWRGVVKPTENLHSVCCIG
jgi:hypothetical protein